MPCFLPFGSRTVSSGHGRRSKKKAMLKTSLNPQIFLAPQKVNAAALATLRTYLDRNGPRCHTLRKIARRGSQLIKKQRAIFLYFFIGEAIKMRNVYMTQCIHSSWLLQIVPPPVLYRLYVNYVLTTAPRLFSQSLPHLGAPLFPLRRGRRHRRPFNLTNLHPRPLGMPRPGIFDQPRRRPVICAGLLDGQPLLNKMEAMPDKF